MKLLKPMIVLLGIVILGKLVFFMVPSEISDSTTPIQISNDLLAPATFHNLENPSQPIQRITIQPEYGLNHHDKFESDFATKLQIQFQENIHQLKIQASLLSIRERIFIRYPNDGLAHFSRVMYLAFPELAATILSIVDRLTVYQQWLEENQSMLDTLSMLASNGTIWQKRRELFGSDAEIIWSEEREKIIQKQLQIQQAIIKLDQDYLPLDEKLYQLQIAIAEIHEGMTQAVSGGVVAQVFFNLDSVQRAFIDLSPEERQSKINHIRETLGYSEQQVIQLQELDERRNERWDNGLSYMAERDTLVKTTDASLLSGNLTSLRERYFKNEADTIQREEEKSDFWRFKRPRIYGQN